VRVNDLAEVLLATSLLLLCAAPTAMSRIGGFASPDDPLDPGALRLIRGRSLPDRFTRDIFTSPWRSAIATAHAMDLTAKPLPTLADLDPGAWAGQPFAAIDHMALQAWLADPLAGAPGGETLSQGKSRVGQWIDQVANGSGPLCAITHPMIIRAVLSHTLGFPLETTLAIDIAPLSQVLLSHNGKWRLQLLTSH
jgi:broad specificity phosphatase PhoE